MLVTIIPFLLSLQYLDTTSGYKHVILMHGLFGSPESFSQMREYIERVHPGTNVTTIDAFDHKASLQAMWKQTYIVRGMMSKAMKEHPEGTHLICHSQGGLVCRAVLETLPDHNVHNFISVSAPQGGQFGDTSYLKCLFPHVLKEKIYEFFYTVPGQKISIANYWNDPHHQDRYRLKSEFLAVINNQSTTNHSLSHEFKKNFLRIKNLILIGGPDDTVITPWQSSHFAAFDENETVVEMRKQPWYTEDSFGLKTLDRRHALVTYSMSGNGHREWTRNYTLFRLCIEQWLD